MTITLSSIAGFLLSIGMGVDANIIIYERIKEELRAGKTLRVAVESGFKKAFSTILDSNVTTLIAAIVLICLRHQHDSRLCNYVNYRYFGKYVYRYYLY